MGKVPTTVGLISAVSVSSVRSYLDDAYEIEVKNGATTVISRVVVALPVAFVAVTV